MRSATVLDGVKVQRSDRSPTDPNNIATEFIMYKFPNGTHYNVYPRAFTFQALGSTHLDIQIHAVNSGTNGTTNLGSLPYYPVRYVPSEPYGMLDNWSVRLKNDSWAPEGDYVFVATAERIFGNGEKQVIRSSPFKITYGDA